MDGGGGNKSRFLTRLAGEVVWHREEWEGGHWWGVSAEFQRV